jgi:acetyl esterase/lipase
MCVAVLLALGLAGLAAGPGWAEDKKEAKAPEPQAVEVITGVAYNTGEGAHERHKLDLYLPKGKKGYPVVFFIHGGGWTRGDKRSAAAVGKSFAKNGIGFVAINYRLTKHPEHIQDVARAFAWANANLGKYGADVDKVFVSGHSAGGHLAALLATDKGALEPYKLDRRNIRGVIPISGVFRIGDKMTKVFGDAESRKSASPLTHVRGGVPPMLILYAENEPAFFGADAKALCGALKKAGNAAVVKMQADRNHGTIMGRIVNEDDPARKLIVEFIATQTSATPAPKEKR